MRAAAPRAGKPHRNSLGHHRATAYRLRRGCYRSPRVFAISGIAALIVFVLARPQEPLPLLQRVPFLHLFTALAVLGWVIDVRLRRPQPVAAPTLPWVAGLFLWIIIGTAVVAPEQLITRAIDTAILFVLYAVIAHGVQRLRTFQLVAGVMAATCMFITLVCFHQGLARL